MLENLEAAVKDLNYIITKNTDIGKTAEMKFIEIDALRYEVKLLNDKLDMIIKYLPDSTKLLMEMKDHGLLNDEE